MEGIAQLLPLIAIFALFWFLLIRPQMKRQKELRSMQHSLSVGDEVMLSAGILGTVREIETATGSARSEDRMRVEIAPGVTVTVARGAVGQVVNPQPGPGHEEL